MARLRLLGSEFHTPADFHPGTNVLMPYLEAFDRYQRYLNNDLDPLFHYQPPSFSNGLHYYIYRSRSTGMTVDETWAIKRLNLFQAVCRYLAGAVFEESPVLVEPTPEQETWWEERRPAILREMRRAVDWQIAKGRGVLQVEQRLTAGGVGPHLSAVDPSVYLPLVDYIDRDMVVGHALLRLWWPGPRQQSEHPTRATVSVYVDDEGAALSDGRIPAPVATQTTYVWSGGATGVLGDVVEAERPSRVLALETWGDDDAIFADMESAVLAIMVAKSMAGAVLHRHAFSPLILPQVIDPANAGGDQGFRLDLHNPIVWTSPSLPQGGSAFGYADNPAGEISAAYIDLVLSDMEDLAYTSGVSREAFGIGMATQESGDARERLQHSAKSRVRDIRDDIANRWPKLAEALGMPGGADSAIIWEYEPFERNSARRAEIRADFETGLISLETAQKALGYPVMEIEPTAGQPGGMMEMAAEGGGDSPFGDDDGDE